ncbi:PiggyBac transposable element-derived protein [Nesidiocoris tenuis]|uniref:PiggyBac transposable element-derived protein n=1 Tax=Nesidiocoris tenuis TaxID=355587 RepID=A0ABN7ACU2_9HEMI|nr:PiggyBac transposable element-derived protein [Nesidiocoris tenuis]
MSCRNDNRFAPTVFTDEIVMAGPSSAKRKSTFDDREVPQDLLEIYQDIQSDSDSDQIVLSESESDSAESEDAGSSCETDHDEPQHHEPHPLANGVKFDTDWSDEPLPKKMFEYRDRAGILTKPDVDEPIGYFELFADDRFYKTAVDNTNDFGSKCEKSETEKLPEWKELTEAELKVFLGLLLHTGHVQIPHLADYWNKDPLLNMSCFSSHMSRSRFLMILKRLRFAAEPNFHDSNSASQMYRFSPLLDHFNNRLSAVYSPTRDLSLDVPITLHKGRVVLSHDPRGRAGRRGVRLYTLTDANGIAVRAAVYERDESDPAQNGQRWKTSVEEVVMGLVGGRKGLGHSLYLGEYYTSHGLAVRLLRESAVYATGPLRADRLPPAFSAVQALKQGQLVCKQSQGVSLCKWKDRRHIVYVTAEPDERLVDVRSKGKVKKRPRGLIDHDKKLINVRRDDDIFDCYPCERTQLR